jgi:hypothetical protein
MPSVIFLSDLGLLTLLQCLVKYLYVITHDHMILNAALLVPSAVCRVAALGSLKGVPVIYLNVRGKMRQKEHRTPMTEVMACFIQSVENEIDGDEIPNIYSKVLELLR